MSLVARIKPEVQKFITEQLQAGNPPTTPEIQKHIFESEYSPDSRRQRDAVYNAICQGRDEAIIDLEKYLKDKKSMRKIHTKIEYLQPNLIQKQFKSEDYLDFEEELYRNRFGEMTDTIKKHLEEFALIATGWDLKLKELSKQGKNLVIPSYGPNSGWIIPSWWKWAIRETKLYLRSIKILLGQMNRTPVISQLPGTSVSKAIGYARSTQAALEDGTSWTCECKMINIGIANFCANCGKPKKT